MIDKLDRDGYRCPDCASERRGQHAHNCLIFGYLDGGDR